MNISTTSILAILGSSFAFLNNITLHENCVKFEWTFRRAIRCLVLTLHLIDIVCGVSFTIILPKTYSAMDGDLLIQVLHINSSTTLTSSLTYINLFRMNDSGNFFLKRIKLAPDINSNSSINHVTIGCQYFLYGGHYQIQLVDVIKNGINSTQELVTYENFRVEWPEIKLNLSTLYTPTYPDDDIQVELTFSGGKCRRRKLASAEKPDYWLQVLYCGMDVMCNTTNTINVYTEQVKYLQNKVIFNLSCNLFGMAGQYSVQVRPLTNLSEQKIISQTFILADWNEKFVFNVINPSIMPCDPFIGVGVLFEYPRCIEYRMRDRIRFYGKRQNNVFLVNAPTTLEYIADYKIGENQHAKYFDCELFSERYVEYCFAYLTQSIFGPVAEIRIDCLPTFPLSESDHGGWGEWSDWTPCSSTCDSGYQHRYRFCDSPPPRYGGKYCEGSSIETLECGSENAKKWECLYKIRSSEIIEHLPNTSANIDDVSILKCTCGCVSKFSSSDTIKIIAFSSRSCLGNKLFWLIETNNASSVKLSIDFVALPCPTQNIKIRDGASKASDLIAEFTGITVNKSNVVFSAGMSLLIEFSFDPESVLYSTCNGRFLARATQAGFNLKRIETSELRIQSLGLVQIVSLSLAVFIITMTALLIIHYVIRYRKYQMDENVEYYSPAHTPPMTSRSLATNKDELPPSRAISTSTLISEVVYFVKMRRKNDTYHTILRESTISEKSNHMPDLQCLEKQPTSMHSGSSQSTQTIEKVISPLTIHADICSVASFPCYETKPKFQTIFSNDAPFKRQHNGFDTLKKCERKGNEGSRNDLSKGFSENSSDISYASKVAENECLSSGGSNATLTSGCYSTPARAVNTAKIRVTNQKECKDKKNLEKMLSRPQSEFSLGNAEDFELDYYDYNVLNTTDVPGSYLGMDPAYLVWIPPMEEESSLNHAFISNEIKTTNTDILPRYDTTDTGSNDESPSPICDNEFSSTSAYVATQKCIADSCLMMRNLYQGVVVGEDENPKIEKIWNSNLIPNKVRINLRTDYVSKSQEKTTAATKSYEGLHTFYDDEDIQFADE